MPPMLDPATIIEFVVFGFVFASVCNFASAIQMHRQGKTLCILWNSGYSLQEQHTSKQE